MKRKKYILLLLCAVCVIAFLVYDYQSRVYTHCIAEAGTEITASDFLKDPSKTATFSTKDFKPDTSAVGDQTVTVKSGLFTYHCTLTVQDTVAPKAETSPVSTGFGVAVEPSAYITGIQDATAVTVSYVEEPDYSIYGKQIVALLLTDAGGNSTVCESTLIVPPTVVALEVEVGSEAPVLSDFLLLNQTDASMLSDLSAIDMNVIGTYDIEISVGGETYVSLLRVQDTQPPVIQTKDVAAYFTSSLLAEDFVSKAEDASALTYAFVQEPDMSKAEAQTVVILVTDQGGNQVQAEATLTLSEDTEPPVIHGAKDMLGFLGESISYKTGVAVSDNCDGDLAFSVDNSQVDLTTEGSYDVIYSAVDSAGNETSVTITLTVTERAYSLEQVDKLADAVLAKIITADMTEYEKLDAIYKWVRRNVGYISHSDKGDWIKAAYEGLANKQGDCYVYACVSKELLTRAGIANQDISKIPAKTEHYWNLVDIGEGWHHFDTTPRKDHSVFFYLTEEELLEYSVAHNDSHNYDRAIYTDIE